jgi:hypothetical protein
MERAARRDVRLFKSIHQAVSLRPRRRRFKTFTKPDREVILPSLNKLGVVQLKHGAPTLAPAITKTLQFGMPDDLE